MILEAKFSQHLPLNRQSETYAREDIHLDVSTPGGWVGACTAALAPLIGLIRAHVLAGARIHGDDTTVPVLAKSKTITGRLWTYVRDDQPFGGPAPPAALFCYSRDRGGEHPRRHLADYAGSYRPMPMPGSTISTSPGEDRVRSPRRRAGHMGGASSTCWPTWPRRRSRCRRCAASTPCSTSSATSADCRPNSAWQCAPSALLRSLPSWKRGCGPNAPDCRATTISAGLWTTC